jgi:hypothetical protein
MTDSSVSLTISAAQLESWWICWEDGFPLRIWPRWQAEGWLRKASYMHKSISPWAMETAKGREGLVAELGLEVVG